MYLLNCGILGGSVSHAMPIEALIYTCAIVPGTGSLDYTLEN